MSDKRRVEGLGYISLEPTGQRHERMLGAYACYIHDRPTYGIIIGHGYHNDPNKAVEIATRAAKRYHSISATADAALDKILENL